MAYTTADIITWAKITQGLACLNEAKNFGHIGGSIDVDLDSILRIERMSLEWQLQQDPTDADGYLFPMGNYVLSLVGAYLGEAQQQTGGGAIVINPITSSLPVPYDYVVGVSTPPLSNGQTSTVLSSFIGFNVIFIRGNVPQSTLTTESSYYSWNRTTGLFTVFPAAVTTEIFQIIPIG